MLQSFQLLTYQAALMAPLLLGSLNLFQYIYQLSVNSVVMHVLLCFGQTGQTALMFAAQNGHTTVMSLLLEYSAQMDCRGRVRFRY